VKIIVAASIKGGVGKTSTAVFLAQALVARGHKVLAVDGDHNNNLTDFFLRDVDPKTLEARNVYHVLSGKMNPTEALFPTDSGPTVLPATPTLARAAAELGQDPGALLRFPAALRRLDYQYVVIDTPPALGFELRAALYCADLVLVPVAFTRWTVQGFGLLEYEFQRATQTLGTSPLLRALPSICTPKEIELLRTVDSWCLTQTAILKSSAIRTASNYGKGLKEGTQSWNDFAALAAEVEAL
jgi:chromosome partitioning protein